MKPKVTISGVLGIWLGVSVVVGAFLNRVTWGDPNGFHGTGRPFPIVCWDRDPVTGVHKDFIAHPLVSALNPLAIFVVGTAMILAAWWSITLFQRLRKRRASPAKSA